LGIVKINVDAAVSKNSNGAAVAAIAQNVDGNFIWASAVVFFGITDPKSLEAMACREGLSLANNTILHRVRIASDYANVIRSIHSGSMGVYSHVIQEIKAREGAFQMMEFVHERREANYDAYNLVRSSLFVPVGTRVWLVSPPPTFVPL
jgi:ribonuclease HI